ncbi:retinol-binding protein pinta-like [Condylostylus longicornis]|uniref:retinol-binding protein pinta-like n=1 Tax=Condylostylus longicornis TaxID=2530218 RepID=UPI00244DE075|nr:retinol-binding protein pinta-like [Condylostylus longicornis]
MTADSVPEIRELSPELTKVARNELNEDPLRIASDLEQLKEWLIKQPHIKARKDDQFLIAFLRGCKNSIERAKEKLDAYYTYRTTAPEFYAIRDPFDKKILEILEKGVVIPFPDALSDGSRVLINRMCLFDPKHFDMNEVAKVGFMIGDQLLVEDDNFVVCGTVVIVDVKDLSLAHGAQFTPTFVKKMAQFVQDAYPFRLKAIHFVNVPSAFDFFFKLLSGFLSEKIRKRLFVHDNVAELEKHIPKKLLPNEYGGDNGSINLWICKWKDDLLSKREWFLDDEQYKTDESKRIGPVKNPELLFGFDGSFRKLEVD